MQVFLPYPDIKQSLFCLDKRRLAKQRVEAKQLIDTILDRPTVSGKVRTGWKNHPAAVMFRNSIGFLKIYYHHSLEVFSDRGGKNAKLTYEKNLLFATAPWWYGIEEIHASHRGRLLFKGKIDVLADRIQKFTKQRSVNRWLKENGFPYLNAFTEENYIDCTVKLDVLGAAQSNKTNFYEAYGWKESDQLQYVWPGEAPEDGLRILK